MWNKKGMLSGITGENWVEYFALLLIIVGFFLALSTGSAVISYFVMIFSGIIVARSACTFGQRFKTPLVIIVAGFLGGYLLGIQYGNRLVAFVLFILGYIFSIYVHKKEGKDKRTKLKKNKKASPDPRIREK